MCGSVCWRVRSKKTNPPSSINRPTISYAASCCTRRRARQKEGEGREKKKAQLRQPPNTIAHDLLRRIPPFLTRVTFGSRYRSEITAGSVRVAFYEPSAPSAITRAERYSRLKETRKHSGERDETERRKTVCYTTHNAVISCGQHRLLF